MYTPEIMPHLKCTSWNLLFQQHVFYQQQSQTALACRFRCYQASRHAIAYKGHCSPATLCHTMSNNCHAMHTMSNSYYTIQCKEQQLYHTMHTKSYSYVTHEYNEQQLYHNACNEKRQSHNTMQRATAV